MTGTGQSPGFPTVSRLPRDATCIPRQPTRQCTVSASGRHDPEREVAHAGLHDDPHVPLAPGRPRRTRRGRRRLRRRHDRRARPRVFTPLASPRWPPNASSSPLDRRRLPAQPHITAPTPGTCTPIPTVVSFLASAARSRATTNVVSASSGPRQRPACVITSARCAPSGGLGNARKARLPQQALHAHADDAGLLARAHGLPMIPSRSPRWASHAARRGQSADGVRLHPLCSAATSSKSACRKSPRAWPAPAARGNISTFTRWLHRHGSGSSRRRRRVVPRARTHRVLRLHPHLLPSSLCTAGRARIKTSHHVGARTLAGHGRRDHDDVLHIFAACAPYDRLAAAIADRFGGAADSIDLNFPADAPAGLQRELLADIRSIPHRFTGFDTNWPATP